MGWIRRREASLLMSGLIAPRITPSVLQKNKTMNTVTIIAVDPSKCTNKKVGFITDPVITDEVMKKAQGSVSSHSGLRLSLDGATVVVSGSVFPPSSSLAVSTAEILSDAHNAVIQAHELEAANHKNLVDQYAKAYGLPVFQG